MACLNSVANGEEPDRADRVERARCRPDVASKHAGSSSPGREPDAAFPLQQVRLHRGHGAMPLLVGPLAPIVGPVLGLRSHDREVAWRVSQGIRAGLDQGPARFLVGQKVGRALVGTADRYFHQARPGAKRRERCGESKRAGTGRGFVLDSYRCSRVRAQAANSAQWSCTSWARRKRSLKPPWASASLTVVIVA
jgi:hypothetical protein